MRSAWWKKATWDLRGQCEKKTWSVEVPSEQGAGNGNYWEEVCSLSRLFSLHREIIQKCRSSQHHREPVLSPQLLEEGMIQPQGLKPLEVCSLAGCGVLPIRAQLGTGKATAGLGRHGPKSAHTRLPGARFEFSASIIVCLHSAGVLGK